MTRWFISKSRCDVTLIAPVCRPTAIEGGVVLAGRLSRPVRPVPWWPDAIPRQIGGVGRANGWPARSRRRWLVFGAVDVAWIACMGLLLAVVRSARRWPMQTRAANRLKEMAVFKQKEL
ncbi:MAG: hypothetical protein WD738_21385 [Pirellulales bacterium]